MFPRIKVHSIRLMFILAVSAAAFGTVFPTFAQTPPPLPPSSAPPVDPAAQGAEPTNIMSGLMDRYEYDPRGRRDPFVQPLTESAVSQGGVHGPLLPLQRFEINQLRLVGIIWDVKRPRAMIKDPSGGVHIVTPNTKLGPRNGYVAVIREGEIVVVETVDQGGQLNSSAQVVKIAK